MNRREFLTSAIAAAAATQLPAAAVADNRYPTFPFVRFDYDGWNVVVDLVRSKTCLGDFFSIEARKEKHSKLSCPYWHLDAAEDIIPMLDDMIRAESRLDLSKHFYLTRNTLENVDILRGVADYVDERETAS